MSRFAYLGSMLVAAAIALGAAGCGKPSRADLHQAARSLVPPDAIVVLEKDAGCVEGARSPSCVDVYFRLAGHRPLGERLNVFIANAQHSGWKAARHGSGGGEVFVTFSKGLYDGTAGLWLDR